MLFNDLSAHAGLKKLKWMDWPTLQSFSYQTILDSIKTHVCSLVYISQLYLCSALHKTDKWIAGFIVCFIYARQCWVTHRCGSRAVVLLLLSATKRLRAGKDFQAIVFVEGVMMSNSNNQRMSAKKNSSRRVFHEVR